MADKTKDFIHDLKTEFKDIGAKVNRIFDDLVRGKNNNEYAVQADVYQTVTEFVWELDLPGFEKNEVKVQLKDENLSISGKRERSTDQQSGNFFIHERRFGSFERLFQIPEGAQTEQIKAKMENGTLRVTMPKSGAERSKQEINVE